MAIKFWNAALMLADHRIVYVGMVGLICTVSIHLRFDIRVTCAVIEDEIAIR